MAISRMRSKSGTVLLAFVVAVVLVVYKFCFDGRESRTSIGLEPPTYEMTIVDSTGAPVLGASVEIRSIADQERDRAALAKLLEAANEVGEDSGEAGQRIRDELVTLRAETDSKISSYVTNSLGACRVVATGPLELLAKHAAYGTSGVVSLSAVDDTRRERLGWHESGGTIYLTVTLFPQATISGMLLDANGDPLVNSPIAVRCAAAPGGVGTPCSPGLIYSDYTGAFETLVDAPARVILECIECASDAILLGDVVVQPGEEVQLDESKK